MNDAELEGFRSTRYFARSWALLTRDRGWIKPVLVMVAATLVPVVGVIGVIGAIGYAVEWARLTAWGVTSSPKQKNVQVGACIASGWRVFVVVLVWSLACGLISALLAAVPLLGPVLAFAWMIFSILLNLMVMVAALRATIYQRIGAGLRVSVIGQMVRSDVDGLMRIFGMQVVGAAVSAVASFAISLTTLAALFPKILYYADYVTEFDAIMSDSMKMSLFFEILGSLFSVLGPALVVMAVVVGIISVVMMLLGYTAIGLWMRQFNVPAWGREEDPLPGSVPPAGPAYGAGGPYAAPRQQPQAPTSAPQQTPPAGPTSFSPAGLPGAQDAEKNLP